MPPIGVYKVAIYRHIIVAPPGHFDAAIAAYTTTLGCLYEGHIAAIRCRDNRGFGGQHQGRFQ